MKKTLGRGSLRRALSLVVALAMVWGMCPTAGIAEEALGAAPEGGGALAEGGGAQAEGAPEAAEASEGADPAAEADAERQVEENAAGADAERRVAENAAGADAERQVADEAGHQSAERAAEAGQAADAEGQPAEGEIAAPAEGPAGNAIAAPAEDAPEAAEASKGADPAAAEQAGEVEVADAAGFLAAVASGGSIKLMDSFDLPLTDDNNEFWQPLDIDLNGKTITVVEGDDGKVHRFMLFALVTVRDTAGGGKISSPGCTTYGEMAAWTIYGSGAIRLEGGTLECTTPQNISVVDVWAGAFTMTGGELKGAYSLWLEGGPVAISGGTVIGGFRNDKNVSITGGRFSFDPGRFLQDPYFATNEGDLWKVAKPVTEYPLRVGGVQVTSDNAADVLGEADGDKATVKFVPGAEGNPDTLMLDGANIIGAPYTDAGIDYSGAGPLTIALADGTENAVGGENVYRGISSAASITIVGGGSLAAEGKQAGASSGCGVFAPSVTVSGARLTAKGDEDPGIWCSDGSLNIEAGGSVVAEGKPGVLTERGLTIIENGASLIAVGKEVYGAIGGSVKNAVAGTGWTDAAGTQGKAAIATSSGGQDLSRYMRVQFPATHEHDFSYYADGATITAVCGGTEGTCDVTEGLKLTVRPPAGDLTYDGAAKTATLSEDYSTVAFPGTYEIKYYKGGEEIAAADVVGAGDYVASVTVGGATASVGFTIAKATPEVTSAPTATPVAYGQTLKESALSGGAAQVGGKPLPGTFSWSDPDTLPAVSDSEQTEYAVKFTPDDAGNYAVASCAARLRVDPRVAELSWPDTSFAYDGKSHAPTPTVANLVSGDECAVTVEGAKTDVGAYTATATALSNPNYAMPGPEDAKCDFNIAPREAKLSWKGTSFTYDGKSHAPTATVANLVSGDECAVTVEGAKTDVGSYTATATALANANYALPEEATCPFYIVEAASSVTTAPEPTAPTYDGTEQALVTAGAAEGGEMRYSLDGKSFSEKVPTATKAGTYTVWYMVEGDRNHADTEAKSVGATVAPRVAELSWADTSFAYDGKSHAPTATVSNLVPGDACDVTVEGAKRDAGTHTATATKLSNANYALPKVATRAFEVAPRVAELSWEGTSFAYDGKSHKPAATVSNLVSGDECAVTVEGAKTDAGTYEASATKLSNANYALPKEATCGFEVAPRVAELSWADTSFTYDGKSHKPTASVANLVSGDECDVTVEGAQTDAGSYKAAATALSNANYALPEEATCAFDIVEAASSVKKAPEPTDPTYDGTEQALVTAGAAEGGEMRYSLDGKSFSEKVPSATKAGTYTVWYMVEGDKNHADTKAESVEATMAPRVAELSWKGTSFTYDGKSHAPTATVSNLVEGDECDVTVGGAKRDAGTHTATATKLSNANYALPKEATRAFEVAPRVAELSWKGTSFTYDGKSHAPTATVANLVAGDACDATVEGAQTDAGSYKAAATALSNANYALPEEATCAFDIVEAASSVKKAPEPTDPTYDGTEQALVTAGAAEGGEMRYSLDGKSFSEKVPSATKAGTYTVWYMVEGDKNHADTEAESVEATMAPRVAELSWKGTSFTYDGKSHAPTATVSNLVPGDECDVTVEGAKTDAGTHTATATKLSNANYALPKEATRAFEVAPRVAELSWADTSFTYDGKSHKPTASVANLVSGDECAVTVEGAKTDVGTYEASATKLSNANYALPKEATCGFEVAPRVAELSWKGTSFTYDGKSHAPTATVANLVAGDACDATVEGAQTDAGSYKAAATALSNANYALPEEATCAFDIVEAASSVKKAPEPTDPTYDGTEQALVTAGAAEGGEMRYSLDGKSFSEKVPSATKAGTYTVWYMVEGDKNHADTKAKSVGATVAPRVAELSWADTSFAYDGKDHAPTATVSNLVPGDACDVTVEGAKRDAGTHTATATKLSNANYALPKVATRAFEVAPRVAELSWEGTSFAYDGKSHKPAATVSNLVSGDECAVTVEGAKTDAGTYEASATKLSNANYALPKDAKCAFGVAPREAELSWKGTSFTYDGKSHKPAATVSNLVSGDECTVTVAGAKTDAGTYEATATKLSNANYVLPKGATCKFAIAKAKLTSIAKVADQAYAGKAIAPKPTVKSGSKALKAGTDFAYGYKANAKPGTATVTATGKGNYQGTVKTTFRIVAATTSGRAHLQGSGWQPTKSDPAMYGTTDRSLRMEALSLSLPKGFPVKGSIQYRAHVQGTGWQGWRADGATSGTIGESRRIEAVQIRLTGEMARRYDVYYRVHVQRLGWMGWAKNGAKAGSEGQSRRAEAIQVVLVPKGAAAPGATYRGQTRAYAKAFVK